LIATGMRDVTTIGLLTGTEVLSDSLAIGLFIKRFQSFASLY